ncbi:hypothetical protein EXN22_11945 [Pseudomonas tructae]|uniref:Uncharacterized protein n=1 Tax=Pseudomonas tructae TaxID=2518644 RepID=A0A411MI19_9PSED|nr:hypothetical protein [Pseudomonas tructae]QBF26370.1 hypothetical protein EXN22_11945 [Pseudomonas tructae]
MTDLQADTPLATAQDLPPLTVLRLATPVAGFDGGINLDVVESNLRGVLTTIPAFAALRSGDLVQVMLESESEPLNSEFKVTDKDLNRPLSLYVPAERLLPGERALYYQVMRSGLIYARSRPLRVLVKLDRPGGEDTDPAPGHQGLVAAEVGANPVTAEHLRDGVRVRVFHYENKAVGDVVRLSWGGVMRTHTVTPEDLNTPLELQVSGADILEAGDSPNLVVTWEVHDKVYNTSMAWAPHVSVVVDTGQARLPAVTLPQVGPDGYIDLAQLGDDDLFIEVQAQAPNFAIGDKVSLRFVGYIDSGLPTEVRLEQTVDGPLPQTLAFRIANDRVWALASGLAAIDYSVVTGNERRSQRLTVGFTGQPLPLEAPSVSQAPDGLLAYDVTRATVMVPNYLGRTAGHEITLVWLGSMADSKPTLHETTRIVTAGQAAGTAPIPINVTSEHIRLLESGSLLLYYRVRMANSRSTGWRQSAVLELQVSSAGLLPAPIVEDAATGLDPYDYPEGVQVSVSFPGMRVGDEVTLAWKGAAEGGDYTQRQTVAQANQPLPFEVPQAIAQVNLGHSVTVDYQVVLAGTTRPLPSHSLELELRSRTPQLLEPALVGAVDGHYDPLLGVEVAQVRIRYDGMRASDRIQVVWEGTPGLGTPTLMEVDGSVSGTVIVNVPSSAVGANIPGSVMLRYQVLRNELEAVPSPPTTVQVLKPALGALPRPAIEQAWDEQLDLDSFDGDALVTLRRWPFIALGQQLWLEARSGGQVLALLEAHPVDAGMVGFGLTVALPRSFLTNLADDSELTLQVRVDLRGQANPGQAVDFPLASYRVRQGQLHILVSDGGLAGSALPADWALEQLTCAVTLVGRANATGRVTVNGSARFADGSQAADVQLDEQGEQVLWLSDPYAETVLVSGQLDGSVSRHVPVRFSDVFPYDEQHEAGQGVRARATNGALANGRSANRVCFDSLGLTEAAYVQVELSGSARILGHVGQVVSVPLIAGDCVFDVIDSEVEEVTLTFQLPQAGSWTRFSKTVRFSSLASRYRLQSSDDPRPWFLRVNQVRNLEDSHVRIPHMKLFEDHPEGVQGGIGIRALQGDSKGMLVLVEPYLKMAAGDQVQIYCGDKVTPVTPTAYVVRPEDVNELLFIYVPSNRVPKDVHEIWFTVKALSSDEQSSAALKVKIKTTLPGGPNPNPGSPHHTGLMFPIMPPGLIDWDVAQPGVIAHVYPWIYMEVGDALVLSWGGVKVVHRVVEGEVGKIIPVHVPFEVIEAAGDAEELLVLYLLEDEVGNESDGASLPSYAFVEISTFLLPRPVIEPLDSEGFIDLGDLGPMDPLLFTVADFPSFIPGDEVVFQWRGFTDGAVALPPHESEPVRVPQIPPPRRIEYALPNAVVQAIAGGLAYVSYQVIRTGFPKPLRSRTTAIGVRGVATQLREPDVDGRDENYLPDDLSRAVVRIPAWLGMIAGQQVRVFWQGIREDGRPYTYAEQRPLSGSQVGNEVIFVLDAEHIRALKGGKLELFYQVHNASGEPWVSETLELWVGEPAPELVMPEVEEAEDGALDPVGLIVATAVAPIYTGMAPGQDVHLEWLSPIAAGNFFDYIPVTSAQDLPFSVPEEDILPSLNHQVRVRYIVREPGEQSRYSDYLELFIGRAISNPPQPRIEEAKGNVLDLQSFPGDATVVVSPWNGIGEQQRYWLRIDGTDVSGEPLSLALAQGQAVTPGEVDLGVLARTRRNDLRRFSDNSQIDVHMAVGLHPDAQEQEAVVFPSRGYRIKQASVTLIEPQIEEAMGNQLILASFSGDATLTVQPWNEIAEGQVVWITLRGTQGARSAWELPLVDGEAITQAETEQGLSRPIPRSALEILADGSRLSIQLWVDLSGTGDFENAVEAPERGYEVRTLAPVALTVSTRGLSTAAFPGDWRHPRETSGVLVKGLEGQEVSLRLSGNGRFADGSTQKTVTLGEHGEAHEMVRCSSESTTVTASVAGHPDVAAGLAFVETWLFDKSNGAMRARAQLATGAKADGRSVNRICYDTHIITNANYATVTVTNGARIVGYPGDTAVISLGDRFFDFHVDITNTRPGNVRVSFRLDQHPWAEFSKTMTFT